MAQTKKPATRGRPSAGDPQSERPYMPGYGVPKDKKGLLPWAHVTQRMTQATHFWVSTVDPEGHPHATPVDGLWRDNTLYFGGSPTTRRNRNLAANPAACVHLESATDVLILQGEARELHPDRALAGWMSEETKRKYGYAMKPEQYEKSAGVFAFRPRKVLAWSRFPKDATRWRLESEKGSGAGGQGSG